jgi:ubiquinone/menaquinone biosynthesis C-methylase UbiE
MKPPYISAHDRAIADQFTRQARGFAAAPELHNDDILELILQAARPAANDRAIDLACGPGSVACAMAQHVAHVTGLDATQAMLDQASTLAGSRGLANTAWIAGSVYEVPYPSG